MILVGCAQDPAGSLASTGSERLSWSNTPVTFESANGGMSSGMVSASAVNVNLNLNLVATVVPPVVGGQTLQANAIDIVLNKAYVAYNTQGNGYGGGVDVIDILNQSAPTMTSSATYPNVDIAGLKRDGSDLYAAASDASGAKLYHWTLGLLGLVGDLSGSPNIVPLSGAVGTGVTVWSGTAYATSGDNGGLTLIPRTSLLSLALLNTNVPLDISIPDARGVAVGLLGNPRVVTGNHGGVDAKIQKFNNVGADQGTLASLSNPVDDEAKSTIVSGTIFDLATAGQGGTRLVCQSTGAVTSIANPVVAGLTADLTAANSATFGNGLIYVANGAAGIYVYAVEQTNPLFNPCAVTVSYQGRIAFEDGVSVNNVYYSPGRLIVATGLGGFRILTVVQAGVLGLLGTL